MKLKILIASILIMTSLAPVFAQAHKSRNVIIKGTVTGNTNNYNKVYVYIGHEYSDSTYINNGHYTFILPFIAGIVQITPEYTLHPETRFSLFGVLADRPGIYTIQSDVSKSLNLSKVSGTEATRVYLSYRTEKRIISKKIQAVLASEKLKAEDSVYYTKWDSLSKAYYVDRLVSNFILKYRDSYAAVEILAWEGPSYLTAEEQEKLYAALSPALRATARGKEINARLRGSKNGKIGSSVSDFVLQNADGKKTVFSSLKGKYVLVDFWASWCVPCRESFPHMRQLYQKLKGDKFDMLSISVDKSKKNWLKALEEEKNPWGQVFDDQNIHMTNFNVDAFPTLFLIDPQGKIIAREAGFEENGQGAIEKKLNELNLTVKN